MKTDELVTLLAKNATPVEQNATAKRFMHAMGAGSLISLLIVLSFFGVRPDIESAVWLPMFWIKLFFPVMVAGVTLYAATNLARPGRKLGIAPGMLGALLAVVWAGAGVTLLHADPVQRKELVFGDTWLFCLTIVPLLSIPVFTAAMWALKGLAPTRLRLAGGAAGLLAGATGAAVYAVHCPELSMPFIAIWYVLAILVPAFVGSLIGPRLLRW
jgi:hypothetical protein